jgi:hypothetical protein
MKIENLPNKAPEPTTRSVTPRAFLPKSEMQHLDRSTYSCTSRARAGRGSSLTLGASAPIEQFTLFMGLLGVEPSAYEACEVRGSSPASIQRWFSARIGREVLSPSSGQILSALLARSMGYARSPNKSLEPTLGLGLRFRMRLLRSTGPLRPKSWLMRNPSVAHL